MRRQGGLRRPLVQARRALDAAPELARQALVARDAGAHRAREVTERRRRREVARGTFAQRVGGALERHPERLQVGVVAHAPDAGRQLRAVGQPHGSRGARERTHERLGRVAAGGGLGLGLVAAAHEEEHHDRCGEQAGHARHRRVRPVLRSPQDREIGRLAIPALGALAAEPLYLLVDTAIVGHLGTTQLAALAIAATILSTLVGLCIFLTYGTTAQVARLHGAGDADRAGQLAAQSLWLALAIGTGLALGCLVLADPLVALFGGRGDTAAAAARYLRISALGLAPALVALAGQGYLRGTGDLRTPLIVVVAAQTANVVLEVWFVYGLELGLDGSAAG